MYIVNLILVAIILSAFGKIAGAIIGGPNGFLHNAFTGFGGVLILDVIQRVFKFNFNILVTIIIVLIASCAVKLLLNVALEMCHNTQY